MNPSDRPNDNPYSASTSMQPGSTQPISAALVDESLLLQPGRPPSVWLAIAMMLIVFLTSLAFALPVLSRDDSIAAGSRTVIMLMFQGLIIAGFWTRHRLAWQWGRVLAIIGGLIMGVNVAIGIQRGVAPGFEWALWLFGLTSFALITIFFALGRPSAKVYFRLVCPQCHRFTNRAGDFFFQRARCKQCQNVW